MRTTSMQAAIKLAQLGHGPISKIAAGAIKGTVISPTILKDMLTSAGYSVTYHEGPGEDAPEGPHPNGAWVLVKLNNIVAARAYSHDEPDALLQAIYAAMREEDGAVTVADELTARGLQVDPTLRQTLESRYIVSGRDQLIKDLDAFPSE